MEVEMETIRGQIIPKSNNYIAVPGSGSDTKRIVKSQEVRSYEKTFCLQCRKYRNRNISSEFRLYCVVYQRSRRFDLDNSLKTLLDCLQYVHAIVRGDSGEETHRQGEPARRVRASGDSRGAVALRPPRSL